MSGNHPISVKTVLQRKHASLPVYVVIPGPSMEPLEISATSIIEGTANGNDFGRRTIKLWGKGVDDWFVEFTAPFCKKAGLQVGDTIEMRFQLADTSTPQELAVILSANEHLMGLWESTTERYRREAGEHVRAAKNQSTRERRARAVAEKLMIKNTN